MYKICVLRGSGKKLSGSSQIFDTLFKRISTNHVKKGKRNLSLAADAKKNNTRRRRM